MSVSADTATAALGTFIEGDLLTLRLLNRMPSVVGGNYEIGGLELDILTSPGYVAQLVPVSNMSVVSANAPVQWGNTAEIAFGPNTSDEWWEPIEAVALTIGADVAAVVRTNTMTVNPHTTLVLDAGCLLLTAASV
jgi:hypothetical protein